MATTPKFLEEIGLQFFGAVSASISHDIKNTLAIINENAGLLHDFALLAKKGIELPPEKIERVSQAITKQVRRSGSIIANMNEFAHSADHDAMRVNIEKIINLSVNLAKRKALMNGVEINQIAAGSPVEVVAAPFHLIHLLWRGISWSIENAMDPKNIELQARSTDNGALVEIRISRPFKPQAEALFPGRVECTLINHLSASVKLDSQSGQIEIHVPKQTK